MKSTFPLLTCLLIMLVGCQQDEYEIELTPKGEKVQREVTYSNSSNKLNRSEIRRLEGVYDSKGKQIGEATKISSEFGEQMPDDVGGHGIYKHWKSPMGTLTVYTERFRGSNDYASQLELRRSAVDDLVDLVIEWMAAEMGDQREFPKIESFIGTEFRNDMHNLSTGIWQTGFETDTNEPEFWFRVGEFLIERDYFEIEQIPGLVRSFEDGTDGPSVILESLRDRLVRQFDLAKTGIKATEFLASNAQAERSFNKNVRSSKLVNDVLFKKWSKRLSSDFRRDELAYELFSTAFWPPSLQLFSTTTVRVKLHSKLEPVFSNGTWNKDKDLIGWAQAVNDRDTENEIHEIPGFAFSVLSEPDLEYQKSHFGGEVLSGNDLAGYVLWYNGLTKDERAKLDKFIGGFDDSTRIVRELNGFRFKAESSFERRGIEQLKEAVVKSKN